MSERRLMSVQSKLVRVTIVERIRERASARVAEPLPQPVAEVLGGARRRDLARAGYFARVVETELFAPAREPATWITDELPAPASGESPWPSAVAALATRLAEREPAGRPDPDNADAVTWRIPGPGGHVRHYVALALIGDDGDPALKRDVVYGLVVRCVEEVIAKPARSGG